MLSVIDSFNTVKNLPLAKFNIVEKYSDLEKFEFPYYLKADVVGHKTEMGAVIRCNNLKDAEKKLGKMHKRFPKNNIIVQEIIGGVEMIIGLKNDKVFGKLLVVGFGGIFTEVQRDVSFRALPVSRQDIISMVKNLRGSDIFNARGKKYNLENFYTLIEKVTYLADKKNIGELDLNPVIIGKDESLVVDARIELENEV